MSRTDHSSAIALALSLLLHGAALYVCRHAAMDSYPTAANPGDTPTGRTHSRIMIAGATEPPKPLEPPPPAIPEKQHPELPALPQPEPLLPALQPEPIIPREFAPQEPPRILPADGFGELSGAPDATAMHSLSGDIPMQARTSERDQAPLSRAPVSLPRQQADPQPKIAPPDRPGVAHAKDAAAPRPTVEPRSAVSPSNPRVQPESPAAQAQVRDVATPGPLLPATAPSDRPTRIALAEPLPDPIPSRADHEPVSASPGQPAQDSVPGADSAIAPVGDAASESQTSPQSDSDSDPFSVAGSAEFRPGKVTAHFGRRVKTVKPRLSLAGQYDLFSANPSVVLTVRADETGRVREVTVLHSSGSVTIDRACQLAMYEWWFEPPRDPSGKPRPAEMVWTITFRAR